jgi:hypothetical protein
MNDDLSLVQIAVRVGMSCALTAAMAVGIFMVIRFVAWVGQWARSRRVGERLGYLSNEKASKIVSGVCLNSFATTSCTLSANSPNGLPA